MTIQIVEHAPGIAGIVLDNPARRNALDEAMYRTLASLWPRLAEDAQVRAVIVSGAAGAFCSGADLSADLASLPDVDELVDGALLKTGFFPKPLIAAIDGACVAGGFELMLGCDMRLCTAQARFGLPEARWGILPSGGGALKLMSEIGFPRASALLLTGRLFDAQEALALGLVGEIVPPEQLVERAIEVARTISANSPAVTYAVKRYLHAARAPNAELLDLERRLTLLARQTDAAEGIAAFREKRAPRYDAGALYAQGSRLP